MPPISYNQKLGNRKEAILEDVSRNLVAVENKSNNTCHKLHSAFATWPVTLLRKSLRILRQIFIKLSLVIFECVNMKKPRIERAYYSAFKKSHLPNIAMWKRIGIVIIVFILSFFAISWKREVPKLYNKWRSERYVGNSYNHVKLNTRRRKTTDYLLPFLAQIISDKQAVARICDELDIESCISISR